MLARRRPQNYSLTNGYITHTGLPLRSKALIPNVALRRVSEGWKDYLKHHTVPGIPGGEVTCGKLLGENPNRLTYEGDWRGRKVAVSVALIS